MYADLTAEDICSDNPPRSVFLHVNYIRLSLLSNSPHKDVSQTLEYKTSLKCLQDRPDFRPVVSRGRLLLHGDSPAVECSTREIMANGAAASGQSKKGRRDTREISIHRREEVWQIPLGDTIGG